MVANGKGEQENDKGEQGKYFFKKSSPKDMFLKLILERGGWVERNIDGREKYQSAISCMRPHQKSNLPLSVHGTMLQPA